MQQNYNRNSPLTIPLYLYGAIKRCTCKCVGVFWIKCHLHHIMGMPLKNLSTCPTFLPVPKLYEHIIRWWQHIRKGRMDSHTPNVICMCLKYFNLIHSVVIVYTNKHVISSSNNPLLAGYKLGWPNCKKGYSFSTLIKLTPSMPPEKRSSPQPQVGKYKNEQSKILYQIPGNSVTSKDFAIVWCSDRDLS